MDIIKTIFGVGLVLALCSLAFLGGDWDEDAELRAAVAVWAAGHRPNLDEVHAVRAPSGSPAVSAATSYAIPPEPLLIVDAEALNLRAGPSTSAAVLRAMPRGTAVAEGSRNGNWVEVRTGDGTVGWMSARYLREPAHDDPGL